MVGVVKESLETPKIILALATSLGYSPELAGKTQLMKTLLILEEEIGR